MQFKKSIFSHSILTRTGCRICFVRIFETNFCCLFHNLGRIVRILVGIFPLLSAVVVQVEYFSSLLMVILTNIVDLAFRSLFIFKVICFIQKVTWKYKKNIYSQPTLWTWTTNFFSSILSLYLSPWWPLSPGDSISTITIPIMVTINNHL